MNGNACRGADQLLSVEIVECSCGKFNRASSLVCQGCGKPLDDSRAFTITNEEGTLRKVPRMVEEDKLNDGGVTAQDVLDYGPVSLLNQNRNWLCLLCGPTGTGKTYTALRIAEMIDPTFSIDRVAFTPKELLDLFRTTGKREIIVFDEAQEFNARRSQGKSNVEFSKILAMLRFTQISVIFTLPHMNMVDINARRLVHNYLYTIQIDRTTCPPWQRNMSGVYWYEIDSARIPRSGSSDPELRFRYPYVNGQRVTKVWFTRASDQLIADYEVRKRERWNSILTQVRKNIGNAEEEQQPVSRSVMASDPTARPVVVGRPVPQVPQVQVADIRLQQLLNGNTGEEFVAYRDLNPGADT